MKTPSPVTNFPTNALPAIALLLMCAGNSFAAEKHEHAEHSDHVHFSIKSVRNGDWSSPKTWEPPRVPKTGDRVLVSRLTRVRYDVANKNVIRMVQVVGVLDFARDRNTELNVAILKVQNSDKCSESGFACDFRGVNRQGEPGTLFPSERPQLLVGTPESPIPAKHTAKIRLHYIPGMDKSNTPDTFIRDLGNFRLS
jgi:hypothetical protein